MRGISVKRRPHLGEKRWREVLGRFDGSGMSIHAFCEREGVSASSFHRWRLRLAMMPALPAAPEDEAVPTPTPTPTPTPSTMGFIDLGSLAGEGAPTGRLDLKLDLGGGLTLHLVRG